MNGIMATILHCFTEFSSFRAKVVEDTTHTVCDENVALAKNLCF